MPDVVVGGHSGIPSGIGNIGWVRARGRLTDPRRSECVGALDELDNALYEETEDDTLHLLATF